MSLERISIDSGGMAGAKLIGDAKPCPVVGRIGDVMRIDLETVILEMLDPVRAATAAFALVHLDNR
ncbi:hypothetical protein TSA66_13600 [Noviherbaspirillum autotrophicum]|uniref:Uncharacterized protein n=1 Tax=Noviherbaspirillum autotrophicum TaxID=709839 RepID=A0A0C2BK40_9BURK|nr:hypothetical protein TSA66_13600 [Noviherbaspirillum autotrophicum]